MTLESDRRARADGSRITCLLIAKSAAWQVVRNHLYDPYRTLDDGLRDALLRIEMMLEEGTKECEGSD